MITLSEIEQEVEKRGAIIGAPQNLYPTYGYSVDSAYPHIEVDSSGFLHFVVIERGQELDRRTTTELHELLYWIFDSITFSMACVFEGTHRIQTQDCRRLIFSRQEELLGQLDPNWQLRAHKNHGKILEQHPFKDSLSID